MIPGDMFQTNTDRALYDLDGSLKSTHLIKPNMVGFIIGTYRLTWPEYVVFIAGRVGRMWLSDTDRVVP